MGLLAAGEKATAARIREQRLIATKPSDETVNNSAVLQDDDHLSLTVAANTTYLLELEGVYNSGVTPGFKSTFIGPSGISGPTCGIGASAFSGTVVTTTLNWGGAGADRWIRYIGRLVVASTAGTFKLQWAQQTANASNTILRAGTFLRLTVIG